MEGGGREVRRRLRRGWSARAGRRGRHTRGTRLRVFTWGFMSGLARDLLGSSSIFLGGSMQEAVQDEQSSNAPNCQRPRSHAPKNRREPAHVTRPLKTSHPAPSPPCSSLSSPASSGTSVPAPPPPAHPPRPAPGLRSPCHATPHTRPWHTPLPLTPSRHSPCTGLSLGPLLRSSKPLVFSAPGQSPSRPPPACPDHTQASLLLGAENHFLTVPLASPDPGLSHCVSYPPLFTPPL